MGAPGDPFGSSPAARPPITSIPNGQRATSGLSEFATDELVAEIQVRGNRTVPASRITGQMQTRVGRPFDPRALAADIKKLASLPYFVTVRPLHKSTDAGRVIVLEVVERQTLRYVEYLGNESIKDKKLSEATGLSVGGAVDPYAVEEGKRKIAALYQENGYNRAHVEVVEGSQSTDRGVVYSINEGPQERIWKVEFEGNQFASDGQLRNKIQSKPGIARLFGGKLKRELLDADVQALTSYYRSFGFFRAKVGREVDLNEEGTWATIRFSIIEGPRYEVRNVTLNGVEVFEPGSVRDGLQLAGGQSFEQARMNTDINWLQDLYGSRGYIYADVKAETLFLEEPGKIDLVYNVEEGKRWRVGRIIIKMNGEESHTRNPVAINRIPIRPGEWLDTRKLRDSERRLSASTVYNSNPTTGVTPSITPVPSEETKRRIAREVQEKQEAREGTFRGQSPGTDPLAPTPWTSYKPPLPGSAARLSARTTKCWWPGSREVTAKAPLPLPTAEEIAAYRELRKSWEHERRLSAVTVFSAASPTDARPSITPVPSDETRQRPAELPRDEADTEPATDSDSPSPTQRTAFKPPIPDHPAAYGSSVYQLNQPAAPADGWSSRTVHQAAKQPSYPEQGFFRGQQPSATGYPSTGATNYGVQQAVGSSPQQAIGYSGTPYATPPAPANTVYGAPTQAGAPSAPYGGNQYGGVAVGATDPSGAAIGASGSPVQTLGVVGNPAQPATPVQYAQGAPLAPPSYGQASNPAYDSMSADAYRTTAPVNTQMFPMGVTAPTPVPPPNDPFADLVVNLQETQTGRFMVGVAVNSDAGVVGQISLDERNFDWRRIPRSMQDVYDGTAFRGGGQRFRLEAAPGTQVQRYLASWQEPYLFDSPISLNLSASYYDRQYDYWDENRLGGRVGFGYQWVDRDLSGMLTYRGENVKIMEPAAPLPEYLEMEGDNALHGFGVRLVNDKRDNPFLATEGYYLSLGVEQVIGTYQYGRAEFDGRTYALLRERPDHTGRHVLTFQNRTSFTGADTPVYDRFFIGGFSTLRGFDFRGASPKNGIFDVGGDFMFINTMEYMFPLTADDMIHGVAFVDHGTANNAISLDDYRVAPGVGLRVTVPAMGPAPIALDFAWVVAGPETDQTRVFTFNVGFQR